jgi:hypothetical protein
MYLFLIWSFWCNPCAFTKQLSDLVQCKIRIWYLDKNNCIINVFEISKIKKKLLQRECLIKWVVKKICKWFYYLRICYVRIISPKINNIQIINFLVRACISNVLLAYYFILFITSFMY